ncbi:MAG: DUF111 family protein [Betaproteobacteria bacterium]|nr:DUF111 family protein [Betaproteobacteria bacterium]
MSRQILILAQVDDASGEVLQDVAERLHGLGARNLQILASVGKKARPAHVLLIDADETLEEEIALLLGIELGLWGYRVLESRHRHFEIVKERRHAVVRMGKVEASASVGVKRISSGGRLLGLKVEHDDLAALRDKLESCGERVALPRLRAALEEGLREISDGGPLEVSL